MTSSCSGPVRRVWWRLREPRSAVRRVLLAEKNRRPGVKILMSGGTRCNITNARGLRRLDVVSGPVDPAYDTAQSRGIRAIQLAFGENGAFLAPALRRFDVDATVRMFEAAGVATKIEANGKIFPVSDKAAQVLDALVQWVETRVRRFAARRQCSQSIDWTASSVRTMDTP